MKQKTHEEKINQATNMQGAISEQLKEVMAKADEWKALLTKPLETKTININSINCSVQMFSDKITIVLPSKELVSYCYENTGDIHGYKTSFDSIKAENENLKKENENLKKPFYKKW